MTKKREVFHGNTLRPRNPFVMAFLCLWLGFALASCTPPTATPTLQSTPTPSATPIPSATQEPSPQAVDLGAFGKGMPQDAAWSPDGSLLAVKSSGGIYIHDAKTWQVVKTISKSDIDVRYLTWLAFSSDGNELVLMIDDLDTSAFWRYDLQSEALRLWFEDTNLRYPSAPVFSSDGKFFALLNAPCEKTGIEPVCGQVLELRDGTDGRLIFGLQKGDYDDNNEIIAFVFSPDGKQVAVASDDNRVQVWDTTNGKPRYEFQHDSNVVSMAYSPNGKVLASAGADATVRFWDAQTGKNLFILRDFKQGIQCVAYLDDGKKLLVGQSDSNIFEEYALDEQSLPEKPLGIQMMAGEKRSVYPLGDNTITAQTFISPNTHKMAVLLNDSLQIWDLDTGSFILALPEYNGLISTWAISPNANRMAIADNDIHLWDVAARKWITRLPINAYKIQEVHFSPDGKRLAVVGDGNITLWDTATFQKLNEVTPEYGIEKLIYAPDGKQLALAGDKHVQILDVETGLPLQQFATESARALALNFSADGKRLFYVGDIERIGWELASGKPFYVTQTLPGRYGQAVLTFSLGMEWQWNNYQYSDPDANPQRENSLRFFEPSSGQNLYDLADPGVYSTIALTSDGRLLAWCRNNRIELLDAASGQVLTSVDFYASGGISFTPNSQLLFVKAYDDTVHLWDISSVAQRARDTLPSTATPAPTITPTPGTTPEPVSPLAVQEVMPPTAAQDAIRPENIDQLKKLNELGLGQAHTIIWSPDRKSVALGGYPGVHIFGMGASEPGVSLQADGGGTVFRMAYSPDGSLLAGQIGIVAIQVWEVSTGRSLYKFDDLYCWDADIAFTPDNQVLAAQCGQVTYRWSMSDGQQLSKDEVEKRPYGYTSSDGNLIIRVNGNTAHLLDAGNETIIRSSEAVGMTPGLVGFSPDGKTLLLWFYQFDVARSGVYYPGKEYESLIQLWDIIPNELPRLRTSLPAGKWYHWEYDMFGGFRAVSFTPDSSRLATAGGDGALRVWNTQSGELLHTLPDNGQVYFSPDGNWLASIGEKVRFWDITPGKSPKVVWDIPAFSEFKSVLALIDDGHQDDGHQDDGHRLVTTSDGNFYFWQRSGESLAEQPTIVAAADITISAPSVSPDGRWLAYGTDTDLMLGENNPQAPNWRSLGKFSGGPFFAVAQAILFSPDSSFLAAIDAGRNASLWQFDKLTWKPIELGQEHQVIKLVFSPDSKLLLGVSGLTDRQPLYLWDTTTGKRLRTWKANGDQYAFHPTGTILAAVDDYNGKISLFDLRTWELVREMEGRQYAHTITFSPDGNLLVTSDMGSLYIWDVTSGELLKTISGYFNRVLFSPDGKLLIAGLDDGRIQFWGLP